MVFPKKREALYIKSGIILPLNFRPNVSEKTTELVVHTSNAGSDQNSEHSEQQHIKIDKCEIEGSYYKRYTSPLDKVILMFVKVAGSVYRFIFSCLVLIVWIILGTVYKAPEKWQIIRQDEQSVQIYV